MTENEAIQYFLRHPQGPFPPEVAEHIEHLFEDQSEAPRPDVYVKDGIPVWGIKENEEEGIL